MLLFTAWTYDTLDDVSSTSAGLMLLIKSPRCTSQLSDRLLRQRCQEFVATVDSSCTECEGHERLVVGTNEAYLIDTQVRDGVQVRHFASSLARLSINS